MARIETAQMPEVGDYAFCLAKRRVGRVVTQPHEDLMTLQSLVKGEGAWRARVSQATFWSIHSLGMEDGHPVKYIAECVACPDGSVGYSTQIEACEWAFRHTEATQHPLYRFRRASYSIVRPQPAAT